MVEIDPALLPSYLEELRERFTNRMIKSFDRALPLSELFLDRWKRAELLKFGEKTNAYDSTYFYGMHNLNVGKGCWVGPFVIIDASGASLKIGDGVSISDSLFVGTSRALALRGC